MCVFVNLLKYLCTLFFWSPLSLVLLHLSPTQSQPQSPLLTPRSRSPARHHVEVCICASCTQGLKNGGKCKGSGERESKKSGMCQVGIFFFVDFVSLTRNENWYAAEGREQCGDFRQVSRRVRRLIFRHELHRACADVGNHFEHEAEVAQTYRPPARPPASVFALLYPET
jgi:hypothetical protein